MALPIRTVERLFDRLTTTYGTEFTNIYVISSSPPVNFTPFSAPQA